MSITVTCPGCHKKFVVSEKFAGKSGPCKYCKTIIKIPDEVPAAEKVVIHGGESFSSGGKNAQGKLVLKPLERSEKKFDRVRAIIIAVGILGVLLLTFLLRGVLSKNYFVTAAGLCIVTPVIVGGLYPLVKKDEMLESIHGFDFYWRTGVISLVYVGMWGAVAYLIHLGILNAQPSVMWVICSLSLAAFGTFMCMCFYELEWGNALFHTLAFVLATLLLLYLAGINIEEFAKAIASSSAGTKIPPPPM